jgi:tellurite resistance protein TehA-like permease
MNLKRFDPYLAGLPPGYFALVMATGIISVAAFVQGIGWLAHGLLWFNVAAYIVLWILNLLRAFRHREVVFGDVVDHHRGPGYFNFVAATCILGSQFYIVNGWVEAAWFMWWVGLILWAVINYGFFGAVTMDRSKRTLDKGLNGTWLVPVVATQAVSSLATELVAHQPGEHAEMQLFFALCLFMVGCLLYLSFITLIVYRFTFIPFDSGGLTPPYWINMGATAITALAGSNLVRTVEHWGFLVDIEPFIKGLALLFWSFGTWWVPLLLILGAWRHLIRRLPLSHHGQYWSMVFPLGMYTVATGRLADILELEFLARVPLYVIWVALFAWALTMGAACVKFAQMMRESAPAAQHD